MEATISKIELSIAEVVSSGSPVVTITIPLNPVPASRPRVTRWGVYYSKKYQEFIDAAKEILEESKSQLTGPLVVVVESHITRAKTSKLKWPRGDVDNYAKGPLDVITKFSKVWKDDDQVVGLWTSKRFASGEPKIVVSIYELT
jgi:Holliday junction resolvase RusA-like endonuclease